MTIIKNYKLLRRFPVFCNKSRSLLKSGFSIQKTLQIIKADEKDKFYKSSLENLEKELLSGKPWVQSLKILLPEYLPFKFDGLEKIPNMEGFLAELENYYKGKLTFISDFLAKLTYPMVLFFMSFLAFLLFVGIMLPMYQNYFSDLNLAMPKGLNLLLIILKMVKEYFVVLIFFLLFLLVFFAQKILRYLEKILYIVLFNINIGDILWIISILLKSGVDIKSVLNSIKIAKPESLKQGFEKFRSELFLGQTFSRSLIKNFCFSNFQKEQINSAESRSDFAELLGQIAEEIKSLEMKQLTNSLNYIQPIVFLVLGGIIFIFLYLIFIPVINTVNIIT